MKPFIFFLTGLLLALSVPAVQAQNEIPAQPAEEEPEVLTRGPVNEAFARPVNLGQPEGFFAPEPPPPDIAEIPPAERPTDGHYAWIPGYWAWDTERSAYIWVSGGWRAVPPGMAWVPGYWSRTPQGYEWIPGYWTAAGDDKVEYLPPPPALPDVEPNEPPPSPDEVWVAPCWYWYNGGYVPRPGYWLTARPDWVWVPSHYVRTPRGYIFVRGYWDYVLERRGVLFAPVYFPRPIYRRPHYTLSLSIAMDIGWFQFGFFTRPLYSHYYFGDYYDSTYINIGIFPRYTVEHRRSWYDPIYVHDRWRHRRDHPRFAQYEREVYRQRRDDRALRPPHTYREMEQRARDLSPAQRRTFQFAAPLNEMSQRRKANFASQRQSPAVRPPVARHTTDVRKPSDERRVRELKTPTEPNQATSRGDRPTIRERQGRTPDGRRQTTPQPLPLSPPRKPTQLEAPVQAGEATPAPVPGRPAAPQNSRQPTFSREPRQLAPPAGSERSDPAQGLQRRGGTPSERAPAGTPRGRPQHPGNGSSGVERRPHGERGTISRPPAMDRHGGGANDQWRPSRPGLEQRGGGFRSRG